MPRFCVVLVTAAVLVGAAPVRSSPTALVQSLYSWSRSHSFTSDTSGLQPYLTPSLYGGLEKTLRVDRCTNKADIDWDIFSGTQVETYGFRLGAAAVRGGTATVPVTVSAGLTRSRAEDISVKVIAERGAAGWLVSDIMTATPPHGYASLQRQVQYDVAHLGQESSHWTTAQRRCIGPL